MRLSINLRSSGIYWIIIHNLQHYFQSKYFMVSYNIFYVWTFPLLRIVWFNKTLWSLKWGVGEKKMSLFFPCLSTGSGRESNTFTTPCLGKYWVYSLFLIVQRCQWLFFRWLVGNKFVCVFTSSRRELLN